MAHSNRFVGFVLVALCACCVPAAVADHVVRPGGALTLTEDLILRGPDHLEVAGTAEKPCTIDGNHFRIRSDGEWTGRLKLTHCTINRLGHEHSVEAGRVKSGVSAVEVSAAGEGSVVIEDCTFDACNSILITNRGQSSTHFRRNTVLPNSTVPVNKAAELSADVFSAAGDSKAPKVFQSNRIYRGNCTFAAPNWLVGADSVERIDTQANFFIGYRTGVTARGEGTVFRGNYQHVDLSVNDEFPYWSQVSTFGSYGGECLAEHNVVRTGHWVVRHVGGEFRHNLVLEANGHNLLQFGAAKVHHNIFAHAYPGIDQLANPRVIGAHAAVHVVYPTDRLEIYNNTFHGPGIGMAVYLNPGTLLPSLRNNVFYDFRAEALIVPESPGKDEKPGRLGYADYNCFFCPAVPKADLYRAAVEGKTERRDAGFALNDLPKGGRVDEQVDPKFKGPIPEKFPFEDADIKAGKVKVSQILKFYQDAFTPAADSPLIGAGDPADGGQTNIGAVDGAPPAGVHRN